MQIRLAKKSDIATLVMLDSETNCTAWSELDYTNSLNNNQHYIYVLLEHGRIVGCIVFSKIQGEAEILQFWIRRSSRKTGLGKYLLTYTLGELYQKYAISQVFLEVRDGNSEAIGLYIKSGFIQVGRRNNYYTVGTWKFDALVMLKQM